MYTKPDEIVHFVGLPDGQSETGYPPLARLNLSAAFDLNPETINKRMAGPIDDLPTDDLPTKDDKQTLISRFVSSYRNIRNQARREIE